MPLVITVTKYFPHEKGLGGFGGYEVQAGDQIADGLTLGEMLEQVLGLVYEKRLYPMKTSEEIKIDRARYLADLNAPCDDWSSTETHIPF